MDRMRGAPLALALVLAAACAPGSAGRAATTADAASPQPLAAPVAAAPPAPATGRTELREFRSAALGKAMPYWAYLPPGYDEGTKRYPVLFMLHGMGGSYDEWRSFGLFGAADRLIQSGEIDPLIIVLPQGDRAYWMDHANGGGAWGAYTARDLVGEIDSRYRTVGARTGRAIGGVSMGGHGALQLALNNPGTYAVAGAHSLALRRASQALPYFGQGSEFAARDPMSLVKAKTDDARALLLWIDIGDADPWVGRARELHGDLVRLGIEHEWREWPGDHSATYWSAHVADYLRFYGSALRRCSAHAEAAGATR